MNKYLGLAVILALAAGYFVFTSYVSPGDSLFSASGVLTASSPPQNLEKVLADAKASGVQTSKAESLVAQANLLQLQGNGQQALDKLSAAQAELNSAMAQRAAPVDARLVIAVLLFAVAAVLLFLYLVQSSLAPLKIWVPRLEYESENFARFTTSSDVMQKLMREAKAKEE